MSLNAQVLQDLAELSPKGGVFVQELIEKFLKDCPETMVKMREDALKFNYEAVRKAAHYLKSSSGNLGALKLSNLFGELQNLSDKTEAAFVAELILKVEQEWPSVEKAMRLEILRMSEY